MAERADNQNERSAYEYGRPFLREYSDLYGADPLGACVVWRSCSYGPHLDPPGLAYRDLRACALRSQTLRHLRSEEHTSELQSHLNLVCRLLLEKKKKKISLCKSQHTRR